MGRLPIDRRSGKPTRRFADRVAALIDAVANAPGPLSAERRALVAGERLPGPAGDFAEKVRRRASAITDDDIAALRRHGLDDDAIFALTVASAVGEASARLRAVGRDA
jgi:alkylhydroperoxidase family enzyme